MRGYTPKKIELMAELFYRLYYPAPMQLYPMFSLPRQDFTGLELHYYGEVYINPIITFNDEDGYIDEDNTIHNDLLNFVHFGILNDDLDKRQFLSYHYNKFMTLRAAVIKKSESEHIPDYKCGRWLVPLKDVPEEDIQNILDNGIFIPESDTIRQIRENANDRLREAFANRYQTNNLKN